MDVVVSGLLQFFREARGKCELFGVGHAVLLSGGGYGGGWRGCAVVVRASWSPGCPYPGVGVVGLTGFQPATPRPPEACTTFATVHERPFREGIPVRPSVVSILVILKNQRVHDFIDGSLDLDEPT